jgi:type IV pilus assembly protein PilV
MLLSPNTRQAGFTLIDGVVALGILGVGILMAAGMQDFAMSRAREAHEQTISTGLAAEIMERMTYNRANLAAYNGIDTVNPSTRPATTQPAARGDYDQWAARLAETGLAGARGTVNVISTGPAILNQSLVTVAINWGGAFRPHSIRVSTQLGPD